MNNVIAKEELQALFRYACVLSQDQHLAQDLLQSSIEKYIAKCNEGETILDKQAYVRTLIRNLFRDVCRTQKRWKYVSHEDCEYTAISPVDLESVHISQNLLSSIWNTIEPFDRDILYHWAVLEISLESVADIIGVPKGTVLARVHRLRKRLQRSATVNEIGGGKSGKL